MAEPTSSNYPSALDTDVTLGGDAVNLTALELDTSVDASTSTISVAEDISGVNVPCYLLCGSELMWATAKGSGNFTNVDRGAGGTSAASHTSGDDVYVVYGANLFNQLKRAIVAIETELGAAPSGASATVLARLDAADTTVANLDTRVDKALDATGYLDFTDSTELTIATGSVTVTQNWHTIDTESDAATDDLDTIIASGVTDGFVLFIRANNTARTVVIKHNTGNIVTTSAADITLDETYKYSILIYDATLTKWIAFALSSSSSSSSGASVDNLLLNSNFGQWSRLATPTTPAAMTDAAFNGPDCWYSLIQGANATIARDTGIGDSQYSCKLTAGGTTNRYGIAQIRRADISIPLRGESVTFQVLLKPVNNAASGTRDYRMAVLEWTGTADSVTKEVVNDWTSATFTTGNFFTSTTLTLVGTAVVTATHNTETALSVSGTVSASCNNIIVFVWTEDVPTHASDYVLISKPGLYESATTQTWKPDLREKVGTSEEVILLTHTSAGRAESGTLVDLISQFTFMKSVPTASIQGTIKMRDFTGAATRTATTPSINSSTIALSGMYIEINAASWSPANFTAGNLGALMSDAGNGLLLTTGFG